MFRSFVAVIHNFRHSENLVLMIRGCLASLRDFAYLLSFQHIKLGPY